ncbi:phospholipase A1 [Ferrimonas marina]|uniref:Phospholipase A1 n=2 Tax=Ferrimonas marina TaxID=299255 RepID=A0A1M5UFA9_9GAMM|nr:phospholipase A1 [Ferrimonas marina]
MPYSQMSKPRQMPYFSDGKAEPRIDDVEVEFQVGLLIPVAEPGWLSDDQWEVGYTFRAYWQWYNKPESRPMREQLHAADLRYRWSLALTDDLHLEPYVAVEHVSNGRAKLLSHSWDRAALGAAVRWERLRASAKIWQTLNQSNAGRGKAFELEDYYGPGELELGYRGTGYDLRSLFRLAPGQGTGRGYAEVGAVVPVTGSVSIYAKYSRGYGESLVDANRDMERLGVGLMLGRWY